ncbi:MAG TPA: hypothetical protein PLR50_13855, partial [Candidatus Rifleibacterium sp.]|nr:hypothetical protein [Candidatus Rifleibacterium sp.]
MTPATLTIQRQDSHAFFRHSRDSLCHSRAGGNLFPLSRRGIAMPIIFGLVLCLAIWVASLSWT